MKSLVSKIEELQDYLNLPNSISLKVLNPFIREASKKYLQKKKVIREKMNQIL